MRQHLSRDKKTSTGFSIPSLKHPTRGFGLESSAISPQAANELQPLHKPASHDISRISLRTQAKLSISQPGDIYEQEADSVAQQVMQRMAQPVNRQSIQREALPEEEELQMKPLANSITPLVQRQQMPEDEEELQMKSLDNSTLQRQEVPEDEEELQMKPMVQRQAEVGMDATADLEGSINQARGGGQAMADNIREPMEVAFGADFSGVKVHTDGQSDQLNRSIQARAFTTGQDVFFRSGEYNPGSRGGQELLAHELTHVVQQNAGKSVVQKQERETTIYTRNLQQWRKSMQIIDSTDPSDYVHVSRSTTTDPQSFPNQQIPPNSNVTTNDPNKRQQVKTASNQNPNFNRAEYTAANNVHITLEGRYMQVMRELAIHRLDNRMNIKMGPPVAANFNNLNFGDFVAQGQQQVSQYGIQQWINNAADDTEEFLRTNVPGDMNEGDMSEGLREVIDNAIEVVNQVRNSTLNFTNNLITSTPALAQLEANDQLVHYGGDPWPPAFL